MNFKPAKCPNCAGQLQLPEILERVRCMYCGSEVVVVEAIEEFRNTINLNNIFELAQAAEQAANYEESYGYYTKILEVNPRKYRAWYGKAIAAGWLSTLANFRLAEVLSGIDKAVELAPEEERASLSSTAGLELNNIATAILKLAVDNFRLFITLDTYNEFIGRMKLVIATYRKAAILRPGDRTIHENIINAAQQYMYRYTCFDGQSQVWLLDEGYAEAKGFISEAEAQIQRIDPSFKAQIPAHQKGACYLATAIYGSYDCEEVIILRQFRDNTLAAHSVGRLFIRFYYRVGPRIATLFMSRNRMNAFVRMFLNKGIGMIKKTSNY